MTNTLKGIERNTQYHNVVAYLLGKIEPFHVRRKEVNLFGVAFGYFFVTGSQGRFARKHRGY